MNQEEIRALQTDLDALRDALRAEGGEADARHLRKVERTGWAFTLLGWLTAWIAPNPISALALSTGIFARWTMVGHHVVHRGYDKIPGLPGRLHSKRFARGWRRWIDWADWMDVDAWRHEHNTLHHYRLGEEADPDQPELNLETIRNSSLPMWFRKTLVLLAACVWKPMYYAPNTMRALHNHQTRRDDSVEPVRFLSPRMLLPFATPGSWTWVRCYLPYVLLHFVLLPLPFLAISKWAWMSALVNRLLAEVLTNIHAWIIIVPNHAGHDVHRFEEPITNGGEFYLRQIVGTSNYQTGGYWNDFAHGYLNYQIEHHLFPDMTMLQYAKAQPAVREICERHGLTYLQEPIMTRVRKLVRVMVGQDDMLVWGASAPAEASANATDPAHAAGGDGDLEAVLDSMVDSVVDSVMPVAGSAT